MALPRDPDPERVMVCKKCNSMANLPWFNPLEYGAEPSLDDEHVGYCDYHGDHDAFDWMLL